MTATSPATDTAAAAPTQTGFWRSSRARYLMPVAFVTYSLAYLDKSNYAIASAGGMAEDLRLSAGADSLIAASFFLGYFFFQIPGTIYAEQRSARRLVAWSTVTWGLLAVLQGMLSSPAQLIAVRFALGVVEGAVLPSMVMLLGRWFTRGERGRANLPHPGQPGHGDVAVGGLRLAGVGLGLAGDVRRRGRAVGAVGRVLPLAHQGPPGAGA
ncbi:MFS transporter [Streptomyces griseoluteus]|uniref:MFS transporter n=1 Tax=Streptomyces griseoluteus TaxID=29306 RepID=UPI0036F66C00